MKLRPLLVAAFILAITWQAAAAETRNKPTNKNVQADPPLLESVVAGTTAQSNVALANVMAVKPEMPLGPLDILKSYELAMNLVAQKTSADFSAIEQAQQANQISREQAEYLLQQTYQVAMMQFQVLSALHDVLKHDIEQTAEQAKSTARNNSSDTVLVVPLAAAPFQSR